MVQLNLKLVSIRKWGEYQWLGVAIRYDGIYQQRGITIILYNLSYVL